MKQYTIGVDFGTLSVRAVLVRIRDGSVAASAEYTYPHGVISDCLPSGEPLVREFALQHPMDYWEGLLTIIPRIMEKSGAAGDEVAAIGVDFTCSTTLPTLADSTPLCTLPAFSHEPNAYVKLWKHHATSQAQRIEAIARDMHISWLRNSGGRISPEWPLPKLLQLLEEAPALFDQTDVYLEAGEWIVWRLTGVLSRSESLADSKNLHEKGYPPPAFFARVHPRFENILDRQFRGPVIPLTYPAGGLTDEAARLLSLSPGTPVIPAMVDSHAGAPGAGLMEPGVLLSVLGTSACHILLSEENLDITGIAAKGQDGILTGLCN